MHVEVNIALSFLISYLYNKLPRRRVDLFGQELEKGVKQKFQGHWYPDKPFKGSGFRCVRCSGEKVDPLIMAAARSSGLDLQEVKDNIPEELTLWIDPCEVSYRISERSPVKVLYWDRHDDDTSSDTTDGEVHAANHTFNPEALSFQPIDCLSSSLSNLSLSPSSPVPPSTWSSSVSPSSGLMSSLLPSPHPPPPPPATQAAGVQQAPTAVFRTGKTSTTPSPLFTAASFAATKFGSTKLKCPAKRPSRLSPTELGHSPVQQQGGAADYGAGPRGSHRQRSLSPRDARLQFLLDQQQRCCSRGQVSPAGQSSVTYSTQHQVLPAGQSAVTYSTQHQVLSLAPSLHGQATPCGVLSPFAVGEVALLSPSSRAPLSAACAEMPSPTPTSSIPSSAAPSPSLEGHTAFQEDLRQLGSGHVHSGQLQHLLVAN